MAGKGKRYTGGEEAQIVPLNEVEVVDTTTGEVINVDPDGGLQESYDDDPQGGGYDDMQESYSDESQDTGFEASQVRPGKGKGD